VKTLIIIDSQGGSGITAEYLASIPKCTVLGFEPEISRGTPCHPHGLMVGHLAGLVQTEPTQLHFVRIFDESARQIPGSMDQALDYLESLDVRGAVVCRSWGMHASNDLMHLVGRSSFGEWAERYTDWLDATGSADFAAAGNADQNNRRDDIVYPQRLMLAHSNIIGSSSRVGIPSRFSGDGQGLQCLMWGERILLRHNTGWSAGSGTSFAAPKAAGVCCAHGLDLFQWRRFVEEHRLASWASEGWHPKYGWGNREHLWQVLLQGVEQALWPPCEVSGMVGDYGTHCLSWLDFQRIEGHGE
jgi:hypothetical protein